MTVTVLYIILAVVAVIAALLAFVLASPLSVRIRYDKALEVFAGLSFVKIKVFPKDENKKKKSDRAKKEKKKKTNTSSPKSTSERVNGERAVSDEKSKQTSEKGSVKETLVLVYEIVKRVFEAFGKKAEIDIDLLKVIISKPDAADTAVAFGICGGIVSNILAFTSNFKKAKIKDENILVEPDFITGKSSLALDITVRIRTGALVYSLICGYIKGISHK